MKFAVAFVSVQTGRTTVTVIVEAKNAVIAVNEAKAMLNLKGNYDVIATEFWRESTQLNGVCVSIQT